MLRLFKKRELRTIDRVKLDKEIDTNTLCGISGDENNLIISLTSFPERMYEIHYALYSLLTQSVKPSKVILWLAEEEFPNREKDIPEKVLKLKTNGLTIKWCHNIYSYKKLVPALKEFPNSTIVTADDDVFYEKDWLEKLINSHKEFPSCIICHRAHKPKFRNGKVLPYSKWHKKIKSKSPSYDIFFTGVGGVLYPAGCLYKEVFNKEAFTKLAPFADDIWFWAMAVLNRTKIFIAKNNIIDVTYINPERERGLSNEITLFSKNKKGGNDVQLANVVEKYPQILDIVKE